MNRYNSTEDGIIYKYLSIEKSFNNHQEYNQSRHLFYININHCLLTKFVLKLSESIHPMKVKE